MGLNLHKSLIHVRLDADAPNKTRAHRALHDGGSGNFPCHRCKRSLSDSMFDITDWSLDRRLAYLHPICSTCRKQLKSAWASHELVTPKLQRFVRDSMNGLKGAARVRGIAWGLTDDDVLGTYVKQGGNCALTGIRMTYQRGTRTARERSAISVDRIDSERNYTLDNFHLVCRAVNLMKLDMSMEEFGKWCSQVVLHSLKQRPEQAA